MLQVFSRGHRDFRICVQFPEAGDTFDCNQQEDFSRTQRHITFLLIVAEGDLLKYFHQGGVMKLVKLMKVTHPIFATCMSLTSFLKFPEVIKLMKLMELVKVVHPIFSFA